MPARKMNQTNGTNGSSGVMIKCTYPGCTCTAFQSSGDNVRQCTSCLHGWVPHALDTVGIVYQWDMRKAEAVTFDAVFDISSLILFGTQGIPFRLHVCLQRLIVLLEPEDMTRIIQQFNWTWEDFCRGVKLLEADNTSVRNNWVYASVVDETMILGHFLKYKPTQIVATRFLQDIANQGKEENPYLSMVSRQQDSGLQNFFLQNQTRHVAHNSPMISTTSYPVMNGYPPAAQAAPLPAHVPVMLQGMPSTSSPTVRPMVHPDVNGSVASVLLRPVQNGVTHNGSFVKNDSQMQMQNGQQQSFSINITQGNPAPAPQAVIPGKRKLQPKPAPPPQPIIVPEGMQPTFNNAGNHFAATSAQKLAPKPEHSPFTELQNSKKAPTKRVECDHCHKSFCDKGALKIHYSAVHLKEMHRCTVKGCNMMFSSRRSRNRHSSNTNPRLHSNLFAPRRGGILASDSDVPPQNDDDMDPANLSNNLSDDDDDDDMSYEEVGNPDGRSLLGPDSPEDGDGKLVIAYEEDRKFQLGDRIGGTHLGEGFDNKDVPVNLSINRILASTPQVDLLRNNRGLGEQCFLASTSRYSPPIRKMKDCDRNGTEGFAGAAFSTPDSDDDASSLKSEPTLDKMAAFPLTVQRDERGKVIVPSDPLDPNRCVECLKTFKNHFTVRTHYLNVHLRLMHTCTVTGCNASFPSVRSRDRHSANDNLHHKQGFATEEPVFPSTPADVLPKDSLQ